jgi:hypothetical protein
MKSINLILIPVIVSMLAGCSTTPIVLDPVGPTPPSATALVREGKLIVYSATETHPDGEINYFPHSSYHIYTPDGKRFKWVQNHIGMNDESPTVVKLPAGDYKVLAQADGFGRVTVSVVIKWGKLTEVNLETWGRKKTPVTNEAAVVQLPNGYVVGWRAEPLKEAESQ